MRSVRFFVIAVVQLLIGVSVYSVAGSLVRLNNPNKHDSQSFGSSVAKSGSTVVIGARGPAYQGSAYVFVLVGGTWQVAAELVASNGAVGDGFGGSVAIASNGTIVVGAPHASGGGNQYGAAYLFVPPSGGWKPGKIVLNESARLMPTNATTSDLFGQSIAISGDGLRVVVGAPQSFGSGDPGTVYFFLESAGWNQVKVLHADDGFGGDGFGASVSISGHVAVVGAYGANAAYVIGGPNWTETKLLPSDPNAGDFGSSVSMSENTIVVGAPATDHGSGEAFVFTNQAGNWNPTITLANVNGGEFGASVATDGLITVIGMPNAEVGKGNGNGEVVIFNNVWQVIGEVVGEVNDTLGEAVDVSGETAIAGIPMRFGGRGQVLVGHP